MEDEIDGLTIGEDDVDAILDVLEDEESLQEEFSAAVSSVSAESKQPFNSQILWIFIDYLALTTEYDFTSKYRKDHIFELQKRI